MRRHLRSLFSFSISAMVALLATPAWSEANPKLTWSPPALENPQHIWLEDGFTYTRLDVLSDYVVHLPDSTKHGGATIEGGRNIVIRGGSISIPPGASTDMERRALYFKNATGTVHVEGVEISGRGGAEADGIAISAPAATVQIQNVRITDLTGSYSGWHADLVQPFGGVKELRIDRFTGTSSYQGLFLRPDLAPIGSANLRRIDLQRSASPVADRVGVLLWLTTGCQSYPVGLKRVYVAPAPGQPRDRAAFPQVDPYSPCSAAINGQRMKWPTLPIDGEVKLGIRRRPFVGPGVAGIDYRSPGYVAPH